MNRISLSIGGIHHRYLREHLFPGDGKESVAFAFCGQHQGSDELRLLVHKLLLVPLDVCVRGDDFITWPTSVLLPHLDEAARRGWSVIKIHSHPGGFSQFSMRDDASDAELLPSLASWCERAPVHGSVVVLPDGSLFGRVWTAREGFMDIDVVKVVGDDLHFWRRSTGIFREVELFAERTAQAFGADTYQKLKQLRIAVVGCSGTGSPVIEQLARLGVGELVLVDPEAIEERNVNRLLNSTLRDARQKLLKVDIARRSVEAMGLGTVVTTFPTALDAAATVRALAKCDAVFGCMDSVDGRHLLNRLACFYLLPYFDLGVKLIADGLGGITDILGTVHYLQPGSSSLLSRGVYNLEEVRASGLRRASPDAFAALREEGYIDGAAEDRPAVVSVNMLVAALGVNEFLARLHCYRAEPNAEFDQHGISLGNGVMFHQQHPEPCSVLARHAGRGDILPLLDMPQLSDRALAA
jgi:hypothetical protein